MNAMTPLPELALRMRTTDPGLIDVDADSSATIADHADDIAGNHVRGAALGYQSRLESLPCVRGLAEAGYIILVEFLARNVTSARGLPTPVKRSVVVRYPNGYVAVGVRSEEAVEVHGPVQNYGFAIAIVGDTLVAMRRVAPASPSICL